MTKRKNNSLKLEDAMIYGLIGGMSVGMIIGAATSNIGLWVGIGPSMGLLAGLVYHSVKNEK